MKVLQSYDVVFLLLAEETNHPALLKVSDINEEFQQMLWEALQVIGVTFNVGDTISDAGNEISLQTRRMVLQYSLGTLSNHPILRLRLRSNSQAQVLLERLVGIFKCTSKFKALWQRSLDTYQLQPDDLRDRTSIESHDQEREVCVASSSTCRQDRHSDGSSSSKESFSWSLSDSSSGSDKEN
jgi:hypothetical protein